MIEDTQACYAILEALNTGDISVNKWEAFFIQGVLHDRPRTLSAEQRATIARMKVKYLQGRQALP